MTSIEERLTRDIAAVTGGVVVTESDLETARGAIEERIEIGRERSRRRTLTAAAAAAVVLPILGVAAFQTLGDETAPPVTSGPTSPNAGEPTNWNAEEGFLIGRAPTAELVEGVWRVDNSTLAVRFSEPNIISFDDTGRLFGDPAIQGTYEIAGDVILVTVDSPAARCAGHNFVIRASLPSAGSMRWVRADDAPGRCSPRQYSPWVLEQVLPTSDALTGYRAPARGNWKPVADQSDLYGVWLAEGGGYVLEIDRGGAYFLADETSGLIDRGRWSLRGSELTLTSAAESRECAEGDRLVWTGVEQLQGAASFLRASVDQNGCGASWSSEEWLLIPDAGS